MIGDIARRFKHHLECFRSQILLILGAFFIED